MSPALTDPAAPTPAALDAHLGFWLRWVSNHVSRAFAAKVHACGVTVTEWVLLRALLDLPAKSQSQLVQATGLTKGAVSKLVERMLQKGWLTRQTSALDRRQQDVALTTLGLQLVTTLTCAADENEATFFGHLSHEARDQLQQSLQNLVRHHGWQDVPVD